MKQNLVDAICSEIEIRKDEMHNEVTTVYFGGGTPSILTEKELSQILDKLHSTYHIHPESEITLEANPEDMSETMLQAWKGLGVNRLSVGVQSFDDDVLVWMNRNHNASQSKTSINLAQNLGFENISLDLIYGVYSRSQENWQNEVKQALSFNTPHLSCYCLTVEAKTAFHHMAKKGVEIVSTDSHVEEEFFALQRLTKESGVFMYEISNYARPGQESKHNSNYWNGSGYIGFGPGAHSFIGNSRSWNVSNNMTYVKKISNKTRPFQQETLSLNDRYNESIMVGLRQTKGINLLELNSVYGVDLFTDYGVDLERFKSQGLLEISQNQMALTARGLLVADHVSSCFFK